MWRGCRGSVWRGGLEVVCGGGVEVVLGRVCNLGLFSRALIAKCSGV